MKKYCLLIIAISCFHLMMKAQSTQGVQTENDPVTVSYYKQPIGIKLNVESGYPTIEDFRLGPANKSSIKIHELSLKNGELILNYELNQIEAEESFLVKLYHRSDEITQWEKVSEEESFGLFLKPEDFSNNISEYVWTNPISEIIPFEGYHELLLEIEGMAIPPADLNCNEDPPVWGARQRTPHLAVGILGAAAALWSIPVERDADRLYEEYRSETSKEVADPILDEANRLRHRFLIFRNGGLSLIAIGAFTYYWWNRTYKKKLNNYEKYCKGIDIEPVMINDNYLGNGAGIQIRYKF